MRESVRTKEELMQLLTMHRNKDLDEEASLAEELLKLSEEDHDIYANAFAHTFMADYLLLIREHEDCLKHLHTALTISEEHHYTDLLLRLYTIAGLYYNAHFDEVNAIQNLLNAYDLSEEIQDRHQKMVVLNNIASMFFQKADYETALEYINMAYHEFQQKQVTFMSQADLLVVLNLIQLEIYNDHLQNAMHLYREYTEKINSFQTTPMAKHVIRLCELYLANAFGHIEDVKNISDYFILCELHKDKNRTTYFSFYNDVFDILLKIKDQKRSETYLQYMGEMCLEDDVEQQLLLHRNWIRYAETFHLEQVLINSYKQYYLLQKMVEDITNKTKSESMKEKIKMNQILKERDTITQEKNRFETQAKIDDMTKLFNRSYFNTLVADMHQNPQVSTLGIVVSDVDFFKEYNDFYGHHMGDQLLRTIARCLDENGDARFFTARYGGDEFITLCVNVEREDISDYLDHVYESLRNACKEHSKSKVSDKATISCGFSLFANDETFHYEDALTLADAALYKAKASGKNQYVQY